MSGHESTRLADTPPETWANTILWRLATALGYTPDWIPSSVSAEAVITADPDQILDAAVTHIEFCEEGHY